MGVQNSDAPGPGHQSAWGSRRHREGGARGGSREGATAHACLGGLDFMPCAGSCVQAPRGCKTLMPRARTEPPRARTEPPRARAEPPRARLRNARPLDGTARARGIRVLHSGPPHAPTGKPPASNQSAWAWRGNGRPAACRPEPAPSPPSERPPPRRHGAGPGHQSLALRPAARAHRQAPCQQSERLGMAWKRPPPRRAAPNPPRARLRNARPAPAPGPTLQSEATVPPPAPPFRGTGPTALNWTASSPSARTAKATTRVLRPRAARASRKDANVAESLPAAG